VLEKIGRIDVGVLEDAAKAGSLVAELSGEPPADYGPGRSCEWCQRRIHRYCAPHAAGVVLCSRCTATGILPTDQWPQAPGKPPESVKIERHRLASLSRDASRRALRFLAVGRDAGDALDIAWDRLAAALQVGARPSAGARVYLDCLRQLEALAAAPLAPVQLYADGLLRDQGDGQLVLVLPGELAEREEAA
jgi:hypothetical protein